MIKHGAKSPGIMIRKNIPVTRLKELIVYFRA